VEIDRSRLVGIAALVGCILCWGVVPVLLRQLTSSIDAWTANGVRYPLAAFLYWPILWIAWSRNQVTPSLLRRCAVPAMLALGGQVFWALAHYHLQASEIGFLVRLSMIWSLLAALAIFPDERWLLREPRFYLGLVLIVGGFYVLSTSRAEMSVHSRLGILIMLVCSVFFGLYVVSVRRFLSSVEPVLAFGVVSQFVSLGTLIGMWSLGRPEALRYVSAQGWSLLISSSILGIALGHIFLYVAVVRLGAAISTSCQSVAPFVTVAIASVVLNEMLTSSQWGAGLAMVVGAVVLLSSRRSPIDAVARDGV
jgi:drug/metabolite transporter (DMT)-like permease